MNWAKDENAEVYGSARVGGGNPKSVWWNDQVKAAVRRKEAAWKELLGARTEDARERCLEVYKEEKRNVERCIYQARRRSKNSLEGRRMKM